MLYITDGLSLVVYFFNTNNYKTNKQTYCMSCKKNTGNKDGKVIRTKNGRLQMKSHCSVFWGIKRQDL